MTRAPFEHLTDSIAGDCIYDKCSNFVAIDLGDELNANIEMEERLEDYTYQNGGEPLSISLPVIENFCWQETAQELRTAVKYSTATGEA